MLNAMTVMDQAGQTAAHWLDQAEKAVNSLNLNLSDDAKATIIAAFLTAAAQEQHTMTLRGLAEEGRLQNPYNNFQE